jgi:hypothetical protein
MKFSFTKKKIIIIIIIIIVITLSITLPLVLIKSSNNKVTPTTKITQKGDNEYGFCHSITIDGVDQPNKFINFNEEQILFFNDMNGMGSSESTINISEYALEKESSNGIQYMWVYDPTNDLIMKVWINDKVYSPEEISALGKIPNTIPTTGSGYYLVNKIITKYDKTDPKYKKGELHLNPYILTTRSRPCNVKAIPETTASPTLATPTLATPTLATLTTAFPTLATPTLATLTTALPTLATPTIPMHPNNYTRGSEYTKLGFCHSVTINGVDQPVKFSEIDNAISVSPMIYADQKMDPNGIKHTWVYDSTNNINMARWLPNDFYSSTDSLPLLSNPPNTPDLYKNGKFYIVNKIITNYDKTDPLYKRDTYKFNPYIYDFNPYILSNISQQCK